ncbi:DUF4345 family protein [Pelagerythrobacter marensis]|uniref:DUF4345 family protein n=1 Tax=Pelagerythrobacter marensis TaxID=543877 RepID=A0ABZ2D9A6_9SPHN
MRILLTALIFVGGLFYLVTGLGFLVDPVNSGATFGLGASGPDGLATMRADMTAFFLVAGACMLFGAWRRNGDVLLVPAALFGIALLGRVVSVAADGTEPGFWLPMAAEAITVIVLLVASRILPHPAT